MVDAVAVVDGNDLGGGDLDGHHSPPLNVGPATKGSIGGRSSGARGGKKVLSQTTKPS